MRKAYTFDFAAQYAVRSRVARTPVAQRALGAWTRGRLVEMGPVWVKLGQMASVREDLFAPEFVAELESLQDQVPPMCEEDVRAVLGRSAEEFESFEYEPLKAASLGQVHMARLPGQGQVLVKVQRRGVKAQLREDSKNILEAVGFLEAVGLATGSSTRLVLEESCELIKQELNYRIEARNALRFRRYFGSKRWLRVPRVFRASRRVMVMQYVPSAKITDVAAIERMGVSRARVVSALMRFYVEQVTAAGFFHADPHAGNLGVTADGGLAVYDFGIVVELSDGLREAFKEMLGCAVRGDTLRLVDICVAQGIIKAGASSRADVARFFDRVLEKLSQGSVGVGGLDPALVQQLAREKPFVVPTSFVFLARSLLLVQGISKTLKPSFDMYAELEPMLREQVGGEGVVDWRSVAASTVQVPSRLERISSGLADEQRARARMGQRVDVLTDVTAVAAGVGLADDVWMGVLCAAVALFIVRRSR